MGIGQKVRLLHRVIARKAIQHGEDTPHFVVQEPLRVIAFQPLPHQETANTAIEPGFIVVQEEGEVVQVSLPQGGSDVIVECSCLRRLRVKLKDARRLPHSQPLRLGQKTISGAVAVQRPSKFHFRHFLTAFLWHYKAIRLFASASRASWVISCSYLGAGITVVRDRPQHLTFASFFITLASSASSFPRRVLWRMVFIRRL